MTIDINNVKRKILPILRPYETGIAGLQTIWTIFFLAILAITAGGVVVY